MAVVHLGRVGPALPVVSRGHCGFKPVGCHLCPSHGCSPWCSIRAVICPGGTGSGSRWHGRCWAQNLEKHFDFLPRCPSSFTRALSSKGGEERDPYPLHHPISRGILIKWCPCHPDPPILPAQSTTSAHSTHQLPHCSQP